jgi:predicted GNAT family acetyltransferase
MRLTRYPFAADFLAAAQDDLARHEAANCLPLGIASQLVEHPERIETPPYLAAVEDQGRVIAAALMTLPSRFVLSLSESPQALGLLAADARDFSPAISTITGPVPVTQWFADHWRALSGDTVTLGMSERIYQLTRVKPPVGVPGRARPATSADRDLLVQWVGEFELEAFGTLSSGVEARVDGILAIRSRGIYLWEDAGQPVSLAGYGGRTPHGIRIGPVYTPRPLRGRGYASACVATLSQHHLDSGRQFCCLYTDLANPPSNHVYQVIGYQPVCDVQEYRFAPASP